MMGGLTRYIEEGIPPGDFLTAVLCNDLMDAIGKADSENIRNLPAYAAYLYNKAPIGSYGSRKAFKAHMARKAAERAEARNA
jgi:hypothetical protein